MKITKARLKEIIKEELEGVLQEPATTGGGFKKALEIGKAYILGGEEGAYRVWSADQIEKGKTPLSYEDFQAKATPSLRADAARRPLPPAGWRGGHTLGSK